MPRYRAIEKLTSPAGDRYLAGRIVKVGEEFEYGGEPGLAMLPLDAAAAAAKANSIHAADWDWRKPAPGDHRRVQRLAWSLGFTGATVAEAQAHITAWLNNPQPMSVGAQG